MKQMIIAGIIMAACFSTAHAQKAGTKAKSKNKHILDSSKISTTDSAAQVKKVRLNQRKIYHWKSGQRATPTGQQATGVGSGYSALKKDSAAKKENE